jgi:methylthioribose-1-phosphate isomerase
MLAVIDEVDPIRWTEGRLILLDQTLLPEREEWLVVRTVEDAAAAITQMRVRGAPAIGVTAAYAMALAAQAFNGASMPLFLAQFDRDAAKLGAARPTAVNLGWAIRRCVEAAHQSRAPSEAISGVLELAHRIKAEDIATNRAIGKHGAPLMPDEGGVLTHCNTGALATAGYGTALVGH